MIEFSFIIKEQYTATKIVLDNSVTISGNICRGQYGYSRQFDASLLSGV